MHALPAHDRPLSGITVLDMSQFLSGPVAALRLADLGARVIKLERPEVGELGRQLALCDLRTDRGSISFQAMNRGKESVEVDLKDASDLEFVHSLISEADVVVQNFRPGVAERLGVDYATAAQRSPGIIYGTVSGYGSSGPWASKPGQDLLAQSLSGITRIARPKGDPQPVPLSLADTLASIHLSQGIIALLFRKLRTGVGGLVETSLVECLYDVMFETVSNVLHDETILDAESATRAANPYLAAPYGTYATRDGFLALAMNDVPQLGALLDVPELDEYRTASSWWEHREAIGQALSRRLIQQPTAAWLEILEAADVWCAPVLSLGESLASAGTAALELFQEFDGGLDAPLRTTRPPIRIDGRVLTSPGPAPLLGEHNAIRPTVSHAH